MNIKLTELEAAAVRALLVHRAEGIKARPDAGFVAHHLADEYERLAEVVAKARVRKGQISLTLTKGDGQRLEHLIAHDCNPAVRPVLAKIHDARRPKADPRRPNGRRVREEATA